MTSTDMNEFFTALNKAFKRSDSVSSSFLTDIFGVSSKDASFIVKEWRKS